MSDPFAPLTDAESVESRFEGANVRASVRRGMLTISCTGESPVAARANLAQGLADLAARIAAGAPSPVTASAPVADAAPVQATDAAVAPGAAIQS